MFDTLNGLGLLVIGGILLVVSFNTALNAATNVEPVAWYTIASIATGAAGLFMFYDLLTRPNVSNGDEKLDDRQGDEDEDMP